MKRSQTSQDFSERIKAFCERQNMKPSDIGKAIKDKRPKRFDDIILGGKKHSFHDDLKDKIIDYMNMVEPEKVER